AGAARRKKGGVSVEVRWHRGGLGLVREVPPGTRTRAARPQHRLAFESSTDALAATGRLLHQRYVVAVAQEVHRARARQRRARRAWYGTRTRDDRRAPSA